VNPKPKQSSREAILRKGGIIPIDLSALAELKGEELEQALLDLLVGFLSNRLHKPASRESHSIHVYGKRPRKDAASTWLHTVFFS
jgi:hypothetical protein